MKRSTPPSFNYWPGYVDAMFNVVLSVLLITGLMVVGLLCLNLEASRSGNAANQIEKIRKTVQEQKLLAVIGAYLVYQQDRKNASSVAVPQAKTETIPPPIPGMPLKQEWWPVGEASPLRNSSEEWSYLQSQLKKQNQQLGDFDLAGTLPFALVFNPLQYRPNERQIRDIRKYLDTMSDTRNWLILVAAPAENRIMLESGNSRLTAVRNELEAQGVAASHIRFQLLPMNDQLSSGRVVFVLPTKP